MKGVEWKRGWEEEEMATAEFFTGARRAYLFLPLRRLPDAMRLDVGTTEQLSVGWRKIEEINTWFGCDGITTPLHYDAMHNTYDAFARIELVGKSQSCMVACADMFRSMAANV